MIKSNLFFALMFLSMLWFNIFAQIAVKAEKIYTMNGETIANGVILIDNSKITDVGTADEIDIPENYKLVEGKIATPGLIDARTVVGLSGIYNQDHDQDQLETSDPIQPELRAFDAYNSEEELIDWLRKFGITTVNTGHAPGALASGQTMIVKTYGKMEDSILDSVFAVAFSLGNEVSSGFKKPGTRAKGIAMLRQIFVDAKAHSEKNNAPKNLKFEILGKVLNKEVPAIITANTAADILGALRLKREFDFDLILDGAAEAYLVLEEIKNENVPVFLHPMMARTKNISWETPKMLQSEGILFAIQGGYESYVPKVRNVLFETAIAVANGLTFEEALAAVTINPAKILGIDSTVGSIKAGKSADIAVYNGDPFEYTSKCCFVIIDGKVLEEECK